MRYFLFFSLIFCLITTLWADKPVTDDEIYNNVKIKLAGDRDVKGGGIDVTVQTGVVTMKGKVDSEHAKSRAEHLAKRVRGVKSVVNQLEIESR